MRRRYDCGSTYETVPDDQRKQRGPMYRGERGSWWHNRWYPELEFLPDEQRESVPETVSDATVGSHPYGCGCRPCERPEAGALKRRDRARRQAQTRTRVDSSTSSSD